MDFEAIVEKSKAFSHKPPPEVYLEFYGLYKQFNVGDIDIERPDASDKEASGKYEAWLSRKGMSVDAAKAAYVTLYEKYAPMYT
ncbi:acyl-CoA-binding protein [Drosophila busckii]|uniref:acyl-CoA-binding protein n=1 Tax=Drosophila busckii TaxID=30019 RepID=UPI00083E9AEB|nr:acyl-CoA-binding protein [Drosophila busckii]